MITSNWRRYPRHKIHLEENDPVVQKGQHVSGAEMARHES